MMQQKISVQLRVGFFVFVGLITTMMIIFSLGREKKLFESHYQIKAYFEDISGLRVGAQVYLAGISIGFVDSINFTPDLGNKNIEVLLRLSENYQDRIRKDSEASIQTQGLLGDKVLTVSVGAPDQEILKEWDVIKTENSKSFSEYFDKMGSLIENYNRVAVNLNKMLEGDSGDKNKKSFAGIMRSVDNILTKVDNGSGLLGSLVNDPNGKTLVKNLADASASLATLLHNNGGGNAGKSLGIMLNNMATASHDLKVILDGIEKGEGTIGGLIKDPTVFYDLRTLLGKANRNKIVRAVIRGTLATKDEKINQ